MTLLERSVAQGGRAKLLFSGRLLAQRMAACISERFITAFEAMCAPIAPAVCEDERVGIQRFDDENSTYVHILNHQYDAQADCIQPIQELLVRVRNVVGKKLEILALDEKNHPGALGKYGQNRHLYPAQECGIVYGACVLLSSMQNNERMF